MTTSRLLYNLGLSQLSNTSRPKLSNPVDNINDISPVITMSVQTEASGARANDKVKYVLLEGCSISFFYTYLCTNNYRIDCSILLTLPCTNSPLNINLKTTKQNEFSPKTATDDSFRCHLVVMLRGNITDVIIWIVVTKCRCDRYNFFNIVVAYSSRVLKNARNDQIMSFVNCAWSNNFKSKIIITVTWNEY